MLTVYPSNHKYVCMYIVLTVSRLAPLNIKNSITSEWPYCVAYSNGVQPYYNNNMISKL